MNTIKLAMADDHALFRKGMLSMIKEFEGIEVVLEAENGQDLIDQLEYNMPDVILMDLSMPVLDGVAATRIIRPKYPDIRILVLSMSDDERIIYNMMEAGANGYLLKNTEPEELYEAIHTVAKEGEYLNARTSKVMLKWLRSKRKPKPYTSMGIKLTSREVQVLKLICQEMTNTQIADKLCLSSRTVEGYRNRLLDKTGSKNTAGLVMFAVRNELVELNS